MINRINVVLKNTDSKDRISFRWIILDLLPVWIWTSDLIFLILVFFSSKDSSYSLPLLFMPQSFFLYCSLTSLAPSINKCTLALDYLPNILSLSVAICKYIHKISTYFLGLLWRFIEITNNFMYNAWYMRRMPVNLY